LCYEDAGSIVQDRLVVIAGNFPATTVMIKYSNVALQKMPSNKNP